MTSNDTTQDDALLAVAAAWDDAGYDDRRPWEPISFTVGQRVRVRLSAECDVVWDGAGPETPPGHPVEFEGLNGVVIVVAHPDDHRRSWARTHPYGVQFPDLVPVASTEWQWGGAYLSAAELVPLDQFTDDDGGDR